jgi:hypothetical protein
MPIKSPSIAAAVDAFLAAQSKKESDDSAELEQLAGDVRDYIEAAAATDVELNAEGCWTRAGFVFFHSPDGEPTGVPTVARIKQALDLEALRRLKAHCEQKFTPNPQE